MRQVLLLALAVVALAATGSSWAASVEPSSLVLRPGDVPSGFRLDGEESGVQMNARIARDGAEAKRIIARSGRVTGYRNVFDRRASSIESRADLCRSAAGAASLLDWFDLEVRKSGIRGLQRARISVGSGGYVYWSGRSTLLTLVTWRHE